MITDEKFVKDFYEILEDKEIKPVFQPIVSLATGEVYGYEALSRITLKKTELTTDRLFTLAEKLGQVWNLEKLCQKKALKAAVKKPKRTKLFLNVDANVMLDDEFIQEFTKEYVKKYDLKTGDIVFELTERTSVENRELFHNAVEHYKKQGFEIAIDDVGSGYSNLNRISFVEPHYIKIDMELIRDIHLKKAQYSMVGIMAQFCREMNYMLIAEGIETEEELRALMKLGISYGQGYYLGKPNSEFLEVPKQIQKKVLDMKKKDRQISIVPSFFGTVDSICKRGTVMRPEEKAIDAYELFNNNEDCTEISIVDADNNFCGILTKSDILKDFGGMYGYTLHQKSTVAELIKKDIMVVSADFSIENVSKMAMERIPSEIYDAVVVLNENKYYGIVTIKDLLTTATTIQVRQATDANPLTELPGNKTIEEHIVRLVGETRPYAIIYIDLDNFKAYNDAYGFSNGDLMIKAVADSMKSACDKEDFLGHIGGDDFVIITGCGDAKKLGWNIVEHFEKYLKDLYNPTDWTRGYIVSTNRQGLTEQFPIASLSIAVITNGKENYEEMEKLSEKIVKTKKAAKRQQGNSVVEL